MTASMTMIVQLLVLSCACALGSSQSSEWLTFGKAVTNIAKAHNILKENILSMDGNIPLLNDSRRHYAVIIHVIHEETRIESSCLVHHYFLDYQNNINVSAHFALVNPQSVVDETKKVISDITEHISKVAELVEAAIYQSDLAELSIEAEDQTIKPVTDNWHSWNVFLAAGLAATQLNEHHETFFAPYSQNHSAYHFVIEDARKLYKNVISLKNLYQEMYRPLTRLEC